MSADAIDPGALTQALAGTRLGPVEWRAEIGSTNDELVARARAGAPEGAVLGADHQSAGKGRRGRAWVDRPGAALAVSLLLRPPAGRPAGTLPIVIGVGVAEGIGPAARIAWPNDVLVAGRKVAGILTEASSAGGGVEWAVAGIGVNVRGVPDVPDARWPPGALDAPGPAPARQHLAEAILRAVAERYREWCEDGPGPALAAWGAIDALAGAGVRLETPEGLVEGMADGIDAEGRLVVRGPAGPVAVSTAELTRLHRTG